MNKSKFVALLIGLAVNAPALAEGGGFYLGGSLGKAESKEDACFKDSNSGFTCDRKGEVAWSAFAGVMVNKYFGVEGGYHNLGKIVEVANNTTGDRAWVRSYIGEAVGIAALPIQSVSLYVKGGGYYAKSTQTGSFIPTDTKSTTKQWTYGAGASWDVFRHFGLRAEWQRYNNLGGQEIGFRTDVDLMSLGAYFKF
jgi:OOP family OmpA-OmpF porin